MPELEVFFGGLVLGSDVLRDYIRLCLHHVGKEPLNDELGAVNEKGVEKSHHLGIKIIWSETTDL